MNDCVATAPTPASAQGTSPPTANQCDCTATPISPVAGSKATMEKVCTGRSGRSCANNDVARNRHEKTKNADEKCLRQTIAISWRKDDRNFNLTSTHCCRLRYLFTMMW